MDRFITKCIEYNEIPYVLDVMKHHAALRYFPSPDIIHNLIAKLDNEQVLQFVNLLRTKYKLYKWQTFYKNGPKNT